MIKTILRSAIGAMLLLAGGAQGQSTDLPTKPIRVIVPFAAGSGADSSARVMAEQMQKTLGQAVTVENRPGASGALAAVAVKQARGRPHDHDRLEFADVGEPDRDQEPALQPAEGFQGDPRHRAGAEHLVRGQ